MPDKIHIQLQQLARQILEMQPPYDYQKMYDATLKLFEQLILIKNEKGFDKDDWERLENQFDQAIDFIKVAPAEAEPVEDTDDREELPPLMDTIKEIVNEIPETKPSVADLFQQSSQELTFEKKTANPPAEKPISKSLNEQFSKGLQIDLNDRLAFIQHLFDQKPNEYQRAILQIATFETWEESQKFILEMVKPDYQNWEGKQQYETRFLKIIKNNFQ